MTRATRRSTTTTALAGALTVTAATGSAIAGGSGGVGVSGSVDAMNTPAMGQREIVTAQPEPGRVPLVIESAGAPQRVTQSLGSHFGGYYGSRMVIVSEFRDLCTTPCAMWALPGEVPVVLSADGLRGSVETLTVGPTGNRFRFRATPAGPFLAGFTLTVLGSLGLASSATFLGIGAASDAHRCEGVAMCPDRGINDFTWIGIASAAGGLALLIPGIVLIATHPTGIAASEAFPPGTAPPQREAAPAPSPRLTLGGAPMPGGGYVTAGMQF